MSFRPDPRSDGPYQSKLKKILLYPVFIMGPHRSGTTILYKALAETGTFNVTTIYHVLNRDSILHLHFTGKEELVRCHLAEFFHSRGVTNREFDSITMTPDTPEEYAYALDYQGRRPTLNQKNLPGFVRFCRKLQLIQDPKRPLLLKNPFDASNFLYISRAIPQSKFIFIHRHPAQVISSQIKAIRSMLEVDNEYVALVVKRYRQLLANHLKRSLARYFLSERFPTLFHQVARNVAGVNRYFLTHIEELAPCSINVTYTELCTAPSSTVSRILSFLKLDDPQGIDYSKMIRKRETKLLPEVCHRLHLIQRQNERYCEKFGFES